MNQGHHIGDLPQGPGFPYLNPIAIGENEGGTVMILEIVEDMAAVGLVREGKLVFGPEFYPYGIVQGWMQNAFPQKSTTELEWVILKT